MIDETSREHIRKFILSNLVLDNIQENIGYEDDLIMSGIIDSLGIIKLITYLEEDFNIKIKDKDIIPDNFESVNSIFNFISKLIYK